jgi:hypothetical protein
MHCWLSYQQLHLLLCQQLPALPLYCRCRFALLKDLQQQLLQELMLLALTHLLLLLQPAWHCQLRPTPHALVCCCLQLLLLARC